MILLEFRISTNNLYRAFFRRKRKFKKCKKEIKYDRAFCVKQNKNKETDYSAHAVSTNWGLRGN